MRVEETGLPGVLVLVPDVHEDERGHFLETYRADRCAEAGLPGTFPQDNLSFSRAAVLRGLHLQWPRAQGKLIHVLEGEVFDVAVDLRRDSPAFGRWEGHLLSARNRRQIWIPPGFAHGFVVTAPQALLSYKCTDVYLRECELAVRWDDPDLGIDWPVAEPVLSPRDAAAPLLRDIPPDRLPSV
jgi:dTDP-4-dehydrorhamnose 3,5-epimerase